MQNIEEETLSHIHNRAEEDKSNHFVFTASDLLGLLTEIDAKQALLSLVKKEKIHKTRIKGVYGYSVEKKSFTASRFDIVMALARKQKWQITFTEDTASGMLGFSASDTGNCMVYSSGPTRTYGTKKSTKIIFIHSDKVLLAVDKIDIHNWLHTNSSFYKRKNLLTLLLHYDVTCDDIYGITKDLQIGYINYDINVSIKKEDYEAVEKKLKEKFLKSRSL